MEIQAFPKWIYLKKENKAVLVQNEAIEARYGAEGVDYSYRPWPEGEYDKAPVELPDCPKCTELKATFNANHGKLAAEFRAKAADLENALEKIEKLAADRDALKKALADTTEGRDKALQQLADANAAKKAAEAPKAEPKPDDKKPAQPAPAKK